MKSKNYWCSRYSLHATWIRTNTPPSTIHVSGELYRQLIHHDTLRRRREGGFSFMMQGASHSSSSLPIHHHAAISQTVVWKMYHSESQVPRTKVISGFPAKHQTNSTFHNIVIISSASGLALTGFESCSGTTLYEFHRIYFQACLRNVWRWGYEHSIFFCSL